MKLIYAIIVYIVLLLASISVYAKKPSYEDLKTIRAVAIKYDIDTNYLLKIAYIESKFNNRATRLNKNGSMDIGMFQINSIHWDKTCKGLDVFALRGNVECAARIIMTHKNKATIDPQWQGRYHSKTPKHKQKYLTLLAKAPCFEDLINNK